MSISFVDKFLKRLFNKYIVNFPYSVVCVLSGGNIDAIMLGRSLDRGLAAEGRLIKFKVKLLL